MTMNPDKFPRRAVRREIYVFYKFQQFKTFFYEKNVRKKGGK